MKKFRKLAVTIYLFLFIQSLCLSVYAGPDPGCDPDCNCYRDPPHLPCPIDGGVVMLIVLGAAYGIKKTANTHKTTIEAF